MRMGIDSFAATPDRHLATCGRGAELSSLSASARDALDDKDALIPVLRFANAVGAIATTRYGAIPALPRRQDFDALLAQIAL